MSAPQVPPNEVRECGLIKHTNADGSVDVQDAETGELYAVIPAQERRP